MDRMMFILKILLILSTCLFLGLTAGGKGHDVCYLIFAALCNVSLRTLCFGL